MKPTNIVTLSLVASLSLFAAPPHIPNIGDALKQVKPPILKKEEKALPTLEGTQEMQLKEFDSSKKVAIKNIIVDGTLHLNKEELQEIVSSYENKDLSFNDIHELTTKITKLYRVNGYFVARAYTPSQNIYEQDNNLTIAVVEGNYGEFELYNNSLVKNSIIQDNLDYIKKTSIISSASLERAMLVINDTPGANVSKAEVKPGKEIGTSDFVIGVDATNRYSGYTLADNHGSQYTGRHRLIVGADINSPFKLGDKLSLTALTSESAGLLNARVAYGFALHRSGTRANISYSKTTYELGDRYKNLDAIGTSDSITLEIVHSLIRSKPQNLKLYFDTSYNKMKDEVQVSSTNIKKDAFVGTIGLDFTKESVLFGKNSKTSADVSYTLGKLGFKNKEDKEQDKLGANTNGTFAKVNVDLGQDFDLSKDFRWQNSLQMQYALSGKNLDGSQDLSIGGIYGVRYYPDGEESAENGLILKSELFYKLPNFKNLSSNISVFYDIGRVYESKNITGEKARTLQGTGVGLTANYNSFFLNSYLAKNLSSNMLSEEEKFELKFLLQAGWVF